MILVASMAAGLLWRFAVGASLSDLALLRLRGEILLVSLLLAQLALPLLRLAGSGAVFARWAWIATFPILAAIALANSRHPGMWLAAAGLFLNFAVIASNGGMPVLADAVQAVKATGVLTIPAGDIAHVAATAATKLMWLADVIPLPLAPFRTVVSAGDCLLFSGVAAFLGSAQPAVSVAQHFVQE